MPVTPVKLPDPSPVWKENPSPFEPGTSESDALCKIGTKRFPNVIASEHPPKEYVIAIEVTNWSGEMLNEIDPFPDVLPLHDPA